ncbi:tetratricopeptide repeat protein, partial [Pararcticibacter amylolyticus]|uniref:tetratricopeptide repeat protein n=1 Tax=Pararcticibacter amylolyticus TaxID=2173175 RepID=UPI001EE3FC9B
MKKLILVSYLVLQASFLFAQKEKKYVVKGNELYKQQKYKEAEASYRQSVLAKGHSVEGNFNLGDAFYKQKKFTEAGGQFEKIAAASKDKNVAAQAYHNLGNTLLSSKKIQESIEAYKKALLNNPKDDQTRYNLAYAQQLL